MLILFGDKIRSQTKPFLYLFQLVAAKDPVHDKVLAVPFAADFCHCRDCQRTTGAPVGAWMDFRVAQVRWLCGKPTEYASSETIRRGFCAKCGSTLSYCSTQYPEYLTLAITSLDNPEAITPTYHIYTCSQMPWLPIQDDYPRYPKGK
ncbi:GFA family protein [Aeromonas allosaccharophila]|uniref:GFA family protein n=1 Tax=Aeromonas allosaccharophila TaxID=656 RepID=UPI00300665E4